MKRIFDSFMYNGEADVLECRLYELAPIKNLIHIIVEADVDHQDHPKPYRFIEQMDRFAGYLDRIIYVQATGLPTAADDADPWAREHAQRDHIWTGLNRAGAVDTDILLQSDVDEIPRVLQVRNVNPDGLVVFGQRGHFFAVDWLYPEVWQGTVAAKVSTVRKLEPRGMCFMRDARMTAECPTYLRDAGWHLSWLGGNTAQKAKVGSFCHPEILKDGAIEQWLDDDAFYRNGFHVDGKRMRPVDVDQSWPRWVVDGHAPTSWFRPREVAA